MRTCGVIVLLIVMLFVGTSTVMLPLTPTSETQDAAPPFPAWPTETLTVRYQTFERGFMLLREDETCVYAFSNVSTSSSETGSIILWPSPDANRYSYCIPFVALPEPDFSETAPSPMQLPADAFGRVWAAYPEVREGLGYAIQEEFTYEAAPPTPPITTSGGPWSVPVVILPDGSVLSCGTRGATAGTCSISNTP